MNNNTPILIYLQVHKKNGKAVIELRKILNNPEVQRLIISAAFHETPILVFPTFTDKLRGLASLQNAKIIKYNKRNKKYEYLI